MATSRKRPRERFSTPPSAHRGDTAQETEALPSQLANLSLDVTPKVRKKSRQRVLFAAGDSSVSCSVEESSSIRWSDDEMLHLVEYLLHNSDGNSWIASKNKQFWKNAEKFIQHYSSTLHCRTGTCMCIILSSCSILIVIVTILHRKFLPIKGHKDIIKNIQDTF